MYIWVETAFANSIFFEDDGLKIRTINKEDPFQAKKSVGRPKDMDDLEKLI